MEILNIKKMPPSRILLLFFLVAIFIGSFLLMLPGATTAGNEISYLTSLFTITSAIAVTGLTVVDVSKVFTPMGKSIILIFIQLGGLGIMSFSSLVFLLIGKRITYHERKILKEDLNAESTGEVTDLIKRIIMMVFTIEFIGAIFLTLGFLRRMPLKRAVIYGVFHSVSAFCNAGFSLFSDSLEGYSQNVIINMSVAFLIILGGIGFAVINSSIMYITTSKKRFNLTSKMALFISIILTLVGMGLFLLLEYRNPKTIGEMNLFYKIIASFFQSVTTRTAGFNSVPMGDLTPGTIFLFCILMFIGASPGSTGGGIKTTTFGVIAFYVVGIVRGREDIEVSNRRLSWEILNRALAILVISVAYVSTIILLMLVFDDLGFAETIFEVVSAFGTVGLSMGVTPEMNQFSKVLITITMLIGRLGPLTFALALGEQKQRHARRYPKENILIG
ncbi:potassium transporter KtrB [Propionigenium maris DSM 9537]|uniref:Potassium transporter KtrB n=1 Tax=Propionigenium maris DSM 9537 TaxID=1123000 RepID=A0A9W6LMR5_9FUSO|nr:TrkH family potassium uptake protein [Propionigenium maris]GLI55743.1 potassium transporter KtrB [Propionigenium maris DSM 9537]